MVGAKYTLVVGGQTYHGQTDSNGMVSQVVPGGATSGTLTLDMWTVDLTIQQQLDPADTEAGYSARLDNLGYYAEDASMALMRFQSANDLNPTGQMDDATKAKLEEIHGH
jgi:hypothetical protein